LKGFLVILLSSLAIFKFIIIQTKKEPILIFKLLKF